MNDDSSTSVFHLAETDGRALTALCRQDFPADPGDEPRFRLPLSDVNLSGMTEVARDYEPESVIFPHRGLLGSWDPSCTRGGGSWRVLWNYEIAFNMI